MRLVSLWIVLTCFWLLMSGHYTGMLITLGVVSAAGTVLLAQRMGIADSEGHPIHLLARAVIYWPWLVLEIAKSAWRVTWIVLDPALPISPTLLRVRSSQKTTGGRATYANSITLTPGTISVQLDGDDIIVHALEKAGADSLEDGDMDRRVTWFEGAR
ncbi:MAG TPA: Na+/H+ antiporter subunit E [Hyphomicrobiales bacterium]|nr:Na+/H+ antiporter subunit E [Rhodobiaceae bacterium]HXK53760.1 Na+/H+ antiporter subunit E [Hyphomicrobiales bacterium]